MTRRTTRRKGLSVLHIVAGFLVASALLRLGVVSGPAMAEEVADMAEFNAPEDSLRGESAALLSAFQEREERLTERERMLRDRMQALRIAEDEIDEKLEALISAEAALSQMITIADGAAETDLARLTSVYENMKPKEAAALFEEMPPQFAAGFLGLMRPDAAALIMTELAPETAYSFSVVLAGRHANVPTQ